MQITSMRIIYGHPLMSREEIADQFHITLPTVDKYTKEMEESGRYGKFCVVGEGKGKRINFLAFTDHWKYKKQLKDKNARKHVPEYCPHKVAEELGFYGVSD